MSGINNPTKMINEDKIQPSLTTKRAFCERTRDPKEKIFSHHPPCKKYKSHTIQIGQYRFCIGCYIGYPAAICGVILSSWLYLVFHYPIFVTLYTGIGCYLAFLLSFSQYSEIKLVKIAQKFAIGLGSGFVLVFAFFIFDIWIIFKFLIGFGLFFILLQPIRTFHKAKLIAVCNACRDKDTDPNCTEKED